MIFFRCFEFGRLHRPSLECITRELDKLKSRFESRQFEEFDSQKKKKELDAPLFNKLTSRDTNTIYGHVQQLCFTVIES